MGFFFVKSNCLQFVLVRIVEKLAWSFVSLWSKFHHFFTSLIAPFGWSSGNFVLIEIYSDWTRWAGSSSRSVDLVEIRDHAEQIIYSLVDDHLLDLEWNGLCQKANPVYSYVYVHCDSAHDSAGNNYACNNRGSENSFFFFFLAFHFGQKTWFLWGKKNSLIGFGVCCASQICCVALSAFIVKETHRAPWKYVHFLWVLFCRPHESVCRST